VAVESDSDVTGQAPEGFVVWRRRSAAALLATALLIAGVVAVSPTPPSAPGGGPRAASFRHQGVATVVLAAEVANASSTSSTSPVKAKKATSCKSPHADDKPSLFCWAVMYPGDVALIKSQFTGRAGIFGCNDYAVISKEEMKLGKDDCDNDVHTLQEDLPTVKKGMYGVNAMTSSWLNVPVFTLCLDRLLKEGQVWENDFTVKMDPDAVFFPERLGSLLLEHKGKPMFTTNCRFWGGDQVGKLFGSIEVLSKQAIGTYKAKIDTCKNLPWQGWGEDYWMQHCMKAVGVPGVIIADQVSDNTCPQGGFGACSEQKVVFHPKKDAGQWWDCWKQSKGEPSQMVTK